MRDTLWLYLTVLHCISGRKRFVDGINPFLPPRSSCKGAGNWIMKYVVGTVVCVIRAPLFVVFSLLVVVAELLSYLVIVYSFP